MIAILTEKYGPDLSSDWGSFTRDPHAGTSFEDGCGTCLFGGSCVHEDMMLLISIMDSYLNLVRKQNATGAVVDEFHENCWNRIAELLGQDGQKTPKTVEFYGDSLGNRLNRRNRNGYRGARERKKKRRRWSVIRKKREKSYWRTVLNDIRRAEVS